MQSTTRSRFLKTCTSLALICSCFPVPVQAHPPEPPDFTLQESAQSPDQEQPSGSSGNENSPGSLAIFQTSPDHPDQNGTDQPNKNSPESARNMDSVQLPDLKIPDSSQNPPDSVKPENESLILPEADSQNHQSQMDSSADNQKPVQSQQETTSDQNLIAEGHCLNTQTLVYRASDDGISVQVTCPPGSIDPDAVLSLQRLSPEHVYTLAFCELTKDQLSAGNNLLPFDLSFLVDGTPIEPSASVDVLIQTDRSDFPMSADPASIRLLHMPDSSQAQALADALYARENMPETYGDSSLYNDDPVTVTPTIEDSGNSPDQNPTADWSDSSEQQISSQTQSDPQSPSAALQESVPQSHPADHPAAKAASADFQTASLSLDDLNQNQNRKADHASSQSGGNSELDSSASESLDSKNRVSTVPAANLKNGSLASETAPSGISPTGLNQTELPHLPEHSAFSTANHQTIQKQTMPLTDEQFSQPSEDEAAQEQSAPDETAPDETAPDQSDSYNPETANFGKIETGDAESSETESSGTEPADTEPAGAQPAGSTGLEDMQAEVSFEGNTLCLLFRTDSLSPYAVMTAKEEENTEYITPLYCYTVLPGYDGSFDMGDPNAEWNGMGVGSIELIPWLYPVGTTFALNSVEIALPKAFPDITYKGVTYTYDDSPDAPAGTYAIDWTEIAVSPGANSGHNNYNPTISTYRKTIHLNGYIHFNIQGRYSVIFEVQEPGKNGFAADAADSFEVDEGTDLASLAPDLPMEKMYHGEMYRFHAWYASKECQDQVDLNQTVNSDMILYGKYLPVNVNQLYVAKIVHNGSKADLDKPFTFRLKLFEPSGRPTDMPIAIISGEEADSVCSCSHDGWYEFELKNDQYITLGIPKNYSFILREKPEGDEYYTTWSINGGEEIHETKLQMESDQDYDIVANNYFNVVVPTAFDDHLRPAYLFLLSGCSAVSVWVLVAKRKKMAKHTRT